MISEQSGPVAAGENPKIGDHDVDDRTGSPADNQVSHETPDGSPRLSIERSRRILSEPSYRVPVAPPGDHGVAWLRANVPRFCEGEKQRRRRQLVDALLAAVPPAVLRVGDGEPLEALAEALGLPTSVVPDVHVVAASYQPHTEITVEADQAVERLVSICGGVPNEKTACQIALLVQAVPGIDALIEGRNPPAATTRRITPAGETIEVDLAGLAFGAGRHACPGRLHALAIASRKLAFHRLHYDQTPLMLPNAWDFASAAAFARAGFPAIGTTSLGVAAGRGVPDGAGLTLTDTIDLATRLVRLDLPITVDVEDGYGQNPPELAAQLWEIGVAGVNLEDGRGDHLCDPTEQANLLRSFKDGAPGLFVNARIDTHWLGLDEQSTLERASLYEQAGADGIFVPGLMDDRAISALTSAIKLPLNVLVQPNMARLAGLGVRRISAGSLLFRSALGAAVETATLLRDGAELIAPVPSYAAVQALIDS
jgi:2-methylisocitrate lyase-like PEP mutase family enzyme